MQILQSNVENVKNLSGTEIWFFIIARVLVGFGIGVIAMQYYPRIAGPTGFPALVVGLLLFLVAAKGLRRTKLPQNS